MSDTVGMYSLTGFAKQWKLADDREFEILLDRDLRDCLYVGGLFGDEDSDLGGAMFELSPAEVLGWLYEEEFHGRS